MPSRASGKARANKGLAALRDYLGAGRSDPFSNNACESVAVEEAAAKRGEKAAMQFGCVCRGNVLKGGVELVCRRCTLVFHSKCERLDYSAAELAKMVQKNTYLCVECEQVERCEEGYDPALGRFTWQCRTCTRSYEEEDFKAAEMHATRCANMLAARKWSCACDGTASASASSKVMATQCSQCALWFHATCKSQRRNAWEVASTVPKKRARDLCAACENAAAQPGAGGAQPAQPSEVERERREGERVGAARALKAAAIDTELTMLNADAQLSAGEDKPTLFDGRVYVRESTLGAGSGLGLFAGAPIKRNDHVTAYYGVPLYREQVTASVDTSYVVRLPNSGGVLLNGKPYADAIRANPANPSPRDGRHYPVDGAAEWRLGAGAMANDPRDRKRNNAMLAFVKPKPRDGNRALRELAPVLPVLLATRDIAPDEEVFYSYGSEKPFEHIRKALQKEHEQSKRGHRDACKLVWVPHSAA